MKVIKYCSLIVISSIFYSIIWSISAATPRNLKGVSIIQRSDRADDQSIIFKKTTTTNTTTTTDTDQEDETPSTNKIDTINAYLRQVFPEQFILNEIVRTIDGKDLSRSRWYHNNKTHIVIHHTASNFDDIKTPEDALATINAIFKFHTQTKKRWDIGYNFIIDPRGNIYEWRGGWESVIWAHAAYNNAPSLGIALMGNFEINEPTEKQLDALTRLSTALMIKYRINPDNQIYAHIVDDHYPYVKDEVRSAFIGHRDTGKTACPGTNLYNKLPTIRKAIKEKLKSLNMLFPLKPIRYTYYYPKSIFAPKDSMTIEIPYPLSSSIRSCSITDKNIKATKCKSNGSTVSFIATKKKDTIWPNMILLDFTTKDKSLYRIAFKVERASDQALLFIKRRNDYIAKYGSQKPWSTSNKIKEQITKEDIKNLIKNPVKVLLYELSIDQKEWKFLCQDCTIKDDQGNIYTDKSFTIYDDSIALSYISKTTTKSNITSFTITPNKTSSKIFVTNYSRKSYGGIAWNNFYGTIKILRQNIKNIANNTISEEFSLINTLPFELYMRWIIESTDGEPIEKIKTMTILAKNYIVYYLSPYHRHPNIPEWAQYNAIDDARIFQKYVWAGVDSTLTKRKPALESTANEFVMYSGNLAFLPYFTCSAGFTRSAKEKWWWTDTPYLQSVFDPEYCSDFNGHGVGLAGKGATALANKWMKYNEIINYYYPWTTLESL